MSVVHHSVAHVSDASLSCTCLACITLLQVFRVHHNTMSMSLSFSCITTPCLCLSHASQHHVSGPSLSYISHNSLFITTCTSLSLFLSLITCRAPAWNTLRERNKERVSTRNTHTHKDEPSMSLHLSHQSCLSLSDESCLALSHESCLSLSQVFPSLMGHVSPSVIACVSLSILLSLCHRLRLSLYSSLWSAQGYQQPQI